MRAQQLRLLDSFSHRLLKSEIHTSSAHLRLKNHILTSCNSILNQHRIAPRQQQRPKISTESKLSSTSPTQLTTSFGALLFDLVRPGGFSVIRLLRTVHLHLSRTPSSAGTEYLKSGELAKEPSSLIILFPIIFLLPHRFLLVLACFILPRLFAFIILITTLMTNIITCRPRDFHHHHHHLRHRHHRHRHRPRHRPRHSHHPPTTNISTIIISSIIIIIPPRHRRGCMDRIEV